MNEIHPYNNYLSIPESTRLLIIGTAPPQRFSKCFGSRPDSWKLPSEEDVDFYYGSKDNLLWSHILSELYREVFPRDKKSSADSRRSFLKSQKFWMHDICEQYTRVGSGAADDDLDILLYADLRRILEEHDTINKLVFTGGKAEVWSGKQMEIQKLIRPYEFGASGISTKSMPRQRSLSIATNHGERKIQTFTVPSPSPQTLRSYSLDDMIALYRTALCD
jgi:G:T/U-mismatch repair DNA glycosylase